MSQIYVANQISQLPKVTAEAFVTGGSVTLNATGETTFSVGHIELEGGAGSKTISAAGGGSIVWRTVAVTFSNGSTVFGVGLQDVSTATAPAQGDGTFDVYASFTGGGGGITANATQTSVMTSGTKTLTHGDLIAIGFSMTARGGTDSISVALSTITSTTNLPVVTSNTGGTYARVAGSNPCAYIIFDDGTKGWLWMTNFNQTVNSVVNINLDTATADEYGNIVIPTTRFRATGIRALLDINLTANLEAILYSDPFGTPVAERIVTMDGEQSGTSAGGNTWLMFSSYYDMRPNVTYAITIRPTTTSDLGMYYIDSIAGAELLGAPNDFAYACRRIGNTGAFSDYNGGTAKTRLMNMSLVSNYAEQGVNTANYRIGI